MVDRKELKQQMRETFEKQFGGKAPDKFFFAPGRVNLIGEHTDYNGGHVFPCALTIGTYGMIRKREDRTLRFYSLNFEKDGVYTLSLDSKEPNPNEEGWAAYPKGVFWTFEKKGHPIPFGADVLVFGDIPSGSGLSSSASLEVLTGAMIRDTYEMTDVTQVDLAVYGQYSENNYNGLNCGIMDQFASAMGKKDCAIFLDTNTLDFEHAPVVLPDAKIVITNSKVKHSLVTSAYNDRRNESTNALKALQTRGDWKSLGELTEEEFEANKDAITNEVELRRARHAVYENRRTIRAVEALKKNDIAAFGKLMNASHVSLRDDYEVSCKEVDVLVDLAWKTEGCIGSRITGGGFGGCTVSIVRNECVDAFIQALDAPYEKATGYKAEFYVVDIGDGAGELKI